MRSVEDALRAIPAVSKIKRIGDQKEEIEISALQRSGWRSTQ